MTSNLPIAATRPATDDAEVLATFFQALADPTRVRILGFAFRATDGKPGGTNTQGDLAGIGEASRAEADAIRRSGEHESPEATDARRLEAERRADPRVSEGTPEHPRHARMAEGAQNADTRGTGAGGFDRGVDASQVGAPYQGAKPEDPSRATEPGDPGT